MRWLLILAAVALVNGYSQVTPFNSWRALIVYTNSIDSIYGDSLSEGVTMYGGYFASLFDGINQVYEYSDIESSAQIAGVIWDKTYDQMYSGSGYPGCDNMNDLLSGNHGMSRYISLMEKYAADVIILVHHNTYPGGCTISFDAARSGSVRRGVFWTKYPNSLYAFVHEMGHLYSNYGNGDHCRGHRRVFDSGGHELGGPIPDTNSFIVGVTSWQQTGEAAYMIDDVVETEVGNAYRGFYTTMAYGSGGGNSSTYPTSGFPEPCHPVYSHTYGGVSRTFRFNHQGVQWGTPGGNDWLPEWTGTYSNPNVHWIDVLADTSYPTGADSIGYINRLKYLGGPTILRDTTKYYRNFSALIDSRADTIINFKGVPENLTISSDMSLGHTPADSQWVYAHFAATNSVAIEPGFKMGEGGSMRISVGGGGGALARRGSDFHNQRGLGTKTTTVNSELRINYDPALQVIMLSLSSASALIVTAFVYDVKGVRKSKGLTFKSGTGSFSKTISVRDLSAGVYFVQAVVGGEVLRRRFVKW